jgi:sialate O-acetylesterase
MKDFDEAITKLLNTKSLEEANNPQSSGIEKYYAIANTLDEGRKNQGKEWYLPETNTADWLPYKVPDAWEKSALPGFDGIAWARLDVELTAAWTNTNIKLRLGKIDDDDSVWVNGVKIGGTRGWNRLREYTIPGNLIRSGKNTIVVRINDTDGDGGIYGDEDDLYLEQGRNYFNLSGNWLLKPGVAQNALPASIGDLRLQNQPTTLFNAMLHPLIPYTIKGVIWYQGETNAPRAHQYQTLFPLIITDWRKRWNQGDFPFLFVQLANYRRADTIPSESDWAELREAQFMALSLLNTGCATAIDIGEANDIHPKNKQEVGRRLALQAFKLAYGQIIQADGPILEKVTQEGNKIRVSFTSVGSELMVKDKYGYVKGFAVAGKDGKFHYAKGTISSNNEITLESAMVPAPLYVRYGWATNPDDINLYNKDGLPAFPFRTDNFKGITEGKK